MKDLHSHITATLIALAVLDDDNTPAAIDLGKHESAEILLGVGVGGITFNATNKIEIVVTHSDDDDTYEPVVLKDILGVDAVADGGIIKAITSAHAAAAVYRFGYVGGRKYIKVLVSFGGTHSSGTPIFATVLKGHGVDIPEANQA